VDLKDWHSSQRDSVISSSRPLADETPSYKKNYALPEDMEIVE
jgi:hypothetical protein